MGLAKSLGWAIVKGPFWNRESSVIAPTSVLTKGNYLYVEGAADELQDGDYIRTSMGSGVLHVRRG